jgi:hypothetical protein
MLQVKLGVMVVLEWMLNQTEGDNMPLTTKGKKIMKSMKNRYGKKKGKAVFYASKNKGKIKGVDKTKT